MHTIAWSQNLTVERAESKGVTLVDKDTLFSTSDFLSVHVRLSERTRHLVGAAELAQMKPASRIVNTSRGPIIDTSALVAALENGRIAGAAIDVYDVATATDSAYIRTPLKDLIPKLDPEVFWRVHRNAIVRVSAIRQVKPDGDGRLLVWLHGITEPLRVSDAFRHRFRAT
ncbi:hypothetical protein GCM10007863_37740 [Dyella mobilis]|nr:hypothetical protein GCM10007863_37740 [Dyella mobilis]